MPMVLTTSTGTKQTIKWGDKANVEKIDQLILSPREQDLRQKEIDASKLIYHSETFDNKEASKRVRTRQIPFSGSHYQA